LNKFRIEGWFKKVSKIHDFRDLENALHFHCFGFYDLTATLKNNLFVIGCTNKIVNYFPYGKEIEAKMAIEYLKEPYRQEEVENILNPAVRKWFFSRFSSFSLPQLFGVMEIHKRNNILVSAPTGATKTLTGFLSILNELVDSAEKGILLDRVYCVYISPLKALSNDISINLIEPLKEIEKIAGKELGIRVAVRTGDTTQAEKSKMLKNPPHILITTPESLAILLASSKFIEHLKEVQWCIVDEIHALAENKRGVHLSLSLERLARLSSYMARIGLSATISPLDEIASFLVGCDKDKVRDCRIVDVQFIKEMDLKVLSPLKSIINTTQEEIRSGMYGLIHKLIQEHKTTLVFTNTRSATERVVDNLKEMFPSFYNSEIIGAHHGSLSKSHRFQIENSLRQGKMKAVVCSTSLELGIDIGFIDLVVCLSSPKSVARFLQRAGRAGHRLHEKVKGRIIVVDRDDLIECAVLLKSAVEKKIDRIHIPHNCLDVLAQQIHGIAIERMIHIDELFKLVKSSYCYHNLSWTDFKGVLDYLSGKFASLEDRHIYAKIWLDEETGMIGRKGSMSRVIHMTNIGTIPDESFITVKIGEAIVGKLDEAFLERLRPGDIFVLGGETYIFKYTRGMVAQVSATSGRPPTIPSWSSETLPLSFDLANEIGRFRKLMGEKFCLNKSKEEIIKFIKEYLYIDDDTTADSIYEYFYEQFSYAEIPSNTRIVLEHYSDENGNYAIFHSLFGRRVNDCLSRAVAFAVGRTQHKNVEIGINDNGFFIRTPRKVNAVNAFKVLKSSNLDEVMSQAIDNTEILKRRFRHCAMRALMILRSYKGRTKNVGMQQMGSQLLLSAVKRIDSNFTILKEARREVLEDLMDIENTKKVLKSVGEGQIKIAEISTKIPSPFAFNLVIQGYSDILKMEDKLEFLKRMHNMVLAKISLKTRKELPEESVQHLPQIEEKIPTKEDELKKKVWNLKKVPMYAKEEIIRLIDGETEIRQSVIDSIKQYKEEIKKTWPKELRELVFERLGID
jgi:ATP-dependent Lhr-like helicase